MNIREEMHASSAAGPGGRVADRTGLSQSHDGGGAGVGAHDTEWQDDTVWEWVDTKIPGEVPEMNPMIEEFALRTARKM